MHTARFKSMHGENMLHSSPPRLERAGLLECLTNEHNAFAVRLLQHAQFHIVSVPCLLPLPLTLSQYAGSAYHCEVEKECSALYICLSWARGAHPAADMVQVSRAALPDDLAVPACAPAPGLPQLAHPYNLGRACRWWHCLCNLVLAQGPALPCRRPT